MKVLAIFSAILLVAAGSPRLRRTKTSVGPVVKTWTAKELFDVLNYDKHNVLLPYIEDAANQIMLALFLNINWKNVLAAIPSPSGNNTWKTKELEEFLEMSDMDEEYRSAIEHAYAILSQINEEYPGADVRDIPVVVGAVDISTWHLLNLEEAIADPNTRPELIPYLKEALEHLKQKNADSEATVGMVTPVGLIANSDSEYLELVIPASLLPFLRKKFAEPLDALTENSTMPSDERSHPSEDFREFLLRTSIHERGHII